MATEYKLRAYNASGVLQFEIVDFLELAYTKEVNSPGLLAFELAGNHALAAALADKWQVEIWRRNLALGVDWYADFYGLFREPDKEGVDPGIFTARCPGQLSILSWRIVGWKADTANRSKFINQPAETIMKTLVDYNLASNATVANGRVRDGAMTGITVQADAAGGNSVDWFCAYANLLETLQGLARVGGGDFDLVKTGAATWEFQWFSGQLGTDRSADVIFANEFGNMANPRFQTLRLNESTVAIVGGQGEGSARAIAIRTGANYDEDDNNIEVFVDARSEQTTAGLNAKGDEKLDELKASDTFTWDALQMQDLMYGVDYFLGDLVTVRNPFTAENVTQKINKVTVSLDSGGNEAISVETINQ